MDMGMNERHARLALETVADQRTKEGHKLSYCTVALTPPPPLSTPPSASTPRMRGHHAQLPFHCQRLLRVSSPGCQTTAGYRSDPVPRPSMGVHHKLHMEPMHQAAAHVQP